MASYYSVVRFVPTSLAEEFVNVGVVTFGEGRVLGKFLENWSRVEKFAGDTSGVNHARAFQEWIEQTMVPEPSDTRIKPIDEATLRSIANEWAGSVQLSPPRASLLDPDQLLEELTGVFLVEPQRVERSYDRRRVVIAATESLRIAIRARITVSHYVVQTRRPLSANVRPRVFDIVISNGAPRHAVQCFNFNVLDTKKVLDQVDATAFAVEDVRRKMKDFPVSIVAAMGDAPGAPIEQAERTFADVGAEFVQEPEIDAWSQRIAGRLA